MKKCLSTAAVLIFLFTLAAGCSKKDEPTAPKSNLSISISGKILYEKVEGEIHLYNIQTGIDRALFNGSFPERLNNGYIIYVLDYPNRLMVNSEDGLSKTTLVENNKMYFQCPRVSPDGKMIAVHNLFSSTSDNISPGTIVYKIDGSEAARFKDLFQPSWTPDGRLVLSGSYYSFYGPQTTSHEGLFISNSTFSSVQRIDPGLAEPLMPAVSPDGKQVAFVYNKHLWIMNLDGSSLRQVTKSDSEESYPAWSPDGKYLLFNIQKSGSDLAVVPSAGTTAITDETECFFLTNDAGFLNSNNQINNW